MTLPDQSRAPLPYEFSCGPALDPLHPGTTVDPPAQFLGIEAERVAAFESAQRTVHRHGDGNPETVKIVTNAFEEVRQFVETDMPGIIAMTIEREAWGSDTLETLRHETEYLFGITGENRERQTVRAELGDDGTPEFEVVRGILSPSTPVYVVYRPHPRDPDNKIQMLLLDGRQSRTDQVWHIANGYTRAETAAAREALTQEGGVGCHRRGSRLAAAR